MEEWKEYKLGGITSKIGSGATPKGGKESYLGGNIALIRSQNILDFAFSNSGLVYINKDQASKLNNVEVKENDILLNITGDSVARVCIVPQKILPARVNQHVAIIRGNDIVDNRYLLYYLQYIKPYLLSLSQGGATRNALTKKMLEDLDIKVPSKNVQNIIISVLSSLDDKIELNRRINENLEQQAQALFNHYFIEHSEILGDYEKGNLTDIATYTNGLPMQKFRPQDEEKGMPVLKIKELGQGQTDNSSDICSENIANEYKVTNGDVIFSWSGTLMVKVWCGGLCGLNQHLFKVTSEKYPKWYYYFWTKFHLNKFIRIAQDKAVTMGHIRRGDLETSEVLIPKMGILAKLNEIINPIFNQIIGIQCENRNLAQLRDTLLPRLMSGKLEIKDNSYD